MSEKYQLIACIGLRKEKSSEIVTVPVYIKLSDSDESAVSEQKEELMHKVSEALMQRYERQIAEIINNKKQGEKTNE